MDDFTSIQTTSRDVLLGLLDSALRELRTVLESGSLLWLIGHFPGEHRPLPLTMSRHLPFTTNSEKWLFPQLECLDDRVTMAGLTARRSPDLAKHSSKFAIAASLPLLTLSTKCPRRKRLWTMTSPARSFLWACHAH